MKRRTMISVWLVLLAVALAVPVLAQGQTPTSPNQATPPPTRRVGAGLIGFGENQQNSQNNDTKSSNDRTSLKDKKDGEESNLSRLRKGMEKADGEAAAKAGEKTDDKKTPEGAHKEGASEAGKAGGGPSVIGGGAGGGAAGGAGGGKSGGSGGEGTSMSKGESPSISVTGEANAEFVMQRKLEYTDVPDEGEKISLQESMPLTEFLSNINIATNWNIITSEKVKEVTLPYFNLVDATPKQALELLKFQDIYYQYKEIDGSKFLFVMTKEEYNTKTFGDAKPEEFRVKHAEVAYIESAFKPLLSKTGRMLADQRTGIIYVWDAEDNLAQLKKTMTDLDTPLEKREFSVQYADTADIQTVLKELASPAGSMLADARTGTVIVWDTPPVLEQISDAVERLDVPLASKTFEVMHANAEDLTDSVEVMLSERGIIQVDPRTNSLVVTDIPARVEKLGEFIESIDRDLETRTWTIKYGDIDFIADQLESYIPSDMGDIVVNDTVHQITVTGLPARLDKIEELIKTWDIKRRQVLIEAYIVEVNNDIERQFNVNWSYFGSSGNSPIFFNAGEGFKSDSTDALRIGQMPYAVPLYGGLELDANGKITRPVLKNTEGKTVVDYIAGNKVAVTLDYLDKQDKATILSSPRVVVQDGEEATFENATKVPYVSASTIYGGYGGINNPNDPNGTPNNPNNFGYSPNNTNRIEFIDVGTILSVLPYISEDNNILLDVEAEDSTFILQTVLSNGTPSTVPQKTVRRAETQLRVASGETVVLGGLRKDSAQKSATKTPFLGDLPLIGRLFRYPNHKSGNNSLLLFLTTTIVDEHTHPEALALAQAEENIAESTEHNQKNFWGRLKDDIAKGKDEIHVTVGQTGKILSEGELVTLADLSSNFFDIAEKQKKPVTIVVRKHPRAPEEVVTSVTEAAMEANLKVRFSEAASPLVPDFQDPPAEARAAKVETSDAKDATGNKGVVQ